MGSPGSRRRFAGLVVAMAMATGSGALAAAPRSGAATDPSPVPGSPPAGDTGGGDDELVPVFSLRRVPAALAAAVADHNLAADLGAALGDPALGGGRQASCLRVQDGSGRDMHSHNPGLALIPASTLKLATATVVLGRLGSAHRLVTEVRAPEVTAGGTVENLWLVGGGDPLLSTLAFAADAGFAGQPRLATSIEALADGVVAAGVRLVAGTVVGDDSRHDGVRSVPTWEPGYQRSFDVSPLSALVVDKGFVSTEPPVLAASPALHAAGVLRDLLAARGVVFGGPSPAEGAAPAGTRALASVSSPPMAEVVGEMLANSDNLAAEMLVKEVGRHVTGRATTAAGVGVVRSDLAARGIGLGGAVINDGSGLDRADRLSCDSLQGLLAGRSEGDDLFKGLPVAGSSGTLIHRFVRTPAQGRVRAKTGGLNGVVSLAGWVTGGPGGPIRFSLVANDLPRGTAGTALQDRVVGALARYPDAPDPAELAPPVFAPRAPDG